ncbi:glutamine--fructose-6-phosphate transaminase (isomerizing) [Halorarum salinum]|uniref:Glutamine--fructose-6-phosphate aminotransferase [isomerizing] n=1 Tax=Halorarum salinum TaxID=2743089 RepID=A0A7D5LE85_9EURY|nr:glutamine--fructose-6-phosphate transaminase (isomerizing) [Halobaculum salinum]QLG64307.1 glutamine--fructose-6-phosphate transaminase (isomerizing) [Halobaculum salinum]
MCGITACIADGDVVDELLTGLANLEYRGYDSSGIAIDGGADGLSVLKRSGEISTLRATVEEEPPSGGIGIGHTRWSTHGPPTDENAHPHIDCTGSVSVVHNGIIENHEELRTELSERGHRFSSDTDTEVIPHLVEEGLADGLDPDEAFRWAIGRLEGGFAVVMLVDGEETLYATRRGSPLVLGLDGDRRFLASDVPSFLEYTDRVVHLEDGDVVAVGPTGYAVTDADGERVTREPSTVDWRPEDAERDGYEHYMLKEINEQPNALDRTVSGRIGNDGSVSLSSFPPGTFADVRDVQFVACGTSYHAAMYAREHLIEMGVPAYTFRAGEYATAPAPADEDTLVVAVTQSGETADTLQSVRHARDAGARTLAVTNVVGSTASRECDDALFIRAGPEIGVAATKTFSSQVAALSLLGERLVEDVTGEPSPDRAERGAALRRLPADVQRVLEDSPVAKLADEYRGRDAYFFIGRGVGHPVALEGALKFKEITYEHAEGFGSAELKHGPLALVTEDTPVVAVFDGRHGEKALANVEEVRARGAPVIAVAGEGSRKVREIADEFLPVPDTHPDATGVLANVQLQLVSYHVADLLGRAIDKPRNLAKSVTVE